MKHSPATLAGLVLLPLSYALPAPQVNIPATQETQSEINQFRADIVNVINGISQANPQDAKDKYATACAYGENADNLDLPESYDCPQSAQVEDAQCSQDALTALTNTLVSLDNLALHEQDAKSSPDLIYNDICGVLNNFFSVQSFVDSGLEGVQSNNTQLGSSPVASASKTPTPPKSASSPSPAGASPPPAPDASNNAPAPSATTKTSGSASTPPVANNPPPTNAQSPAPPPPPSNAPASNPPSQTNTSPAFNPAPPLTTQSAAQTVTPATTATPSGASATNPTASNTAAPTGPPTDDAGVKSEMVDAAHDSGKQALDQLSSSVKAHQEKSDASQNALRTAKSSFDTFADFLFPRPVNLNQACSQTQATIITMDAAVRGVQALDSDSYEAWWKIAPGDDEEARAAVCDAHAVFVALGPYVGVSDARN